MLLVFCTETISVAQITQLSVVKDTLKNMLAEKQHRGTYAGDPNAKLNYSPDRIPEFWSVAMAHTIMARYPDFRTAYWKDWTYVQGYVFYGFEMLYNATGDKTYLNYIKKYIDNFVDASGNYTGDKLTNLDNLLTGNSIVALYHYTNDERYKKAAEQFRKVFDTYPRSDGQFWHGNNKPNMWIDGIFMGQLFLIRYGKYIGEQDYCLSEAAKQITVFAKHCAKRNTGLFLHAWTEKPGDVIWADKTSGLSPEVWSEGLGWYALIIIETLALIPENHPDHAALLDIYKKLTDGLAKVQDSKTGGWWMIVDKGDKAGNWIDPSGTAMFVYSIKRGIDLGILDKNKFLTVAERGYKSLFEFLKINRNGLIDISGGGDGITIKKDFDTYVNVARVVNAKETVGGFLWASAIMEKSELEKLKSGNNTKIR